MPDTIAPASEVLTLTQAARFLGVSTRTIHRLADRKMIKVYRIKGTAGNNNRRYRASELLGLLEPESGHREVSAGLALGGRRYPGREATPEARASAAQPTGAASPTDKRASEVSA